MNKKEKTKVKWKSREIKETKQITEETLFFCCSCPSAVDDVSLIRQSRCLNGSYVPRMRATMCPSSGADDCVML